MGDCSATWVLEVPRWYGVWTILPAHQAFVCYLEPMWPRSGTFLSSLSSTKLINGSNVHDSFLVCQPVKRAGTCRIGVWSPICRTLDIVIVMGLLLGSQVSSIKQNVLRLICSSPCYALCVFWESETLGRCADSGVRCYEIQCTCHSLGSLELGFFSPPLLTEHGISTSFPRTVPASVMHWCLELRPVLPIYSCGS